MTFRLAQTHGDLLPLARSLLQAGHRVALLDSPPESPAATKSHLLVLDAPLLDQRPPLTSEHLCLATYDHGLHLLGVASRHGPALRAGLFAYPVRARLTLDRATGQVMRAGELELLDTEPETRAPPPPTSTAAAGGGSVQLSHDEAAFAEMVQAAKAWITKGHTYQVNLSLRAVVPYRGEAAALFAALRTSNPSPYQALLVSPEATLVSASPELLLATRGQHLVTRPIAGTRPRGGTPEEDRVLEAELVRDAKERAEHAMLVDLARNDLGRVARFGSVRVTEEAVVERYSHVMHLVSGVEAELAPGRDVWDAFEAIFPCGTITGAPKKRSCEIIDRLEPMARGPYTGSLGLVTPDWSVWNILIRTAVLQDGQAHVQAGAGIVADSDPAREHAECLHKAAALLEALGLEVPLP